MPIKRCPSGSPECALFIVAQLLPRLLGGKSSVATKTHSGEQKSNSKGQQALIIVKHAQGQMSELRSSITLWSSESLTLALLLSTQQ
ncbi:hypothetical protein CTT31_11350 [Pseudoalteromonas maricaloris]|nr:hypothetical protein CTT31_11350 [Pseudoalteromonas flavipulchra]